MFIKLEFKSETEKAYQFQNDSWIPKSILDKRGLKHPYYQVKEWWLSKCVEKIRDNDDEQLKNVLLGIVPMIVKMIDIPIEIRNYWTNYWSDAANNIVENEPRVWGNDCFEGEMSSWF